MTAGRLTIAVAALMWLAGLAVAQAPDRSPRPVPRPGLSPPQIAIAKPTAPQPRPNSAWNSLRALEAIETADPGRLSAPALPPLRPSPETSRVQVFTGGGMRPAPRPWLDRTRPAGPVAARQPAPATPTVRQLASTVPVLRSPRPVQRPANLQRRAAVHASGLAQATAPARSATEGGLCGDPAIRGRVLPPIQGRLPGCSVANPVQVTEVSGIRLSTPSTMNCETAQALNTWARQGAIPAIGRLGGGIAQFRVASHYSCRTRNSRPGARISEHGKGKAIDISGMRLRNGVDVTVLNGWRDPTQSPILRRMWRAACGPFGTVLGPDSDRFHLDHFHLDTASYRSGAYCR